MATVVEQRIDSAIRGAVSLAIEDIVKQETDKALAAVDKRIKEAVARIALVVHEQYAVERNRNEIIIRVKHERSAS